MPDKISVLLVDDHALVRRGFRRMLEDEPDIMVAGEASDGEEAVKLARELAQAGDPDRAQRLLVLALSADSPQIRWWIEGVSHLFPSAIRGAGEVLVSAFKPGF